MKKAFVLFSAILLAAAVFSVPASAKVTEFDYVGLSVDVPKDWKVQEDPDNNTVGLIAPDKSATVSFSGVEAKMPLDEFAKQASEELKGTKPKKSGDAYTFDFDNGSGITSHAIIMGDDEFVAVITITGEHDDIEGILDSMGGLE